MKKYNELTNEEKVEIRGYFKCWLSIYTNEVAIRVLARSEEIINNELTMNLLKELYTRTQEEEKETEYIIGWLLEDYEENKEYNIHSHTSHAQSYRDVLYDMYI